MTKRTKKKQVYTDNKALNKTIENQNKTEAATEYIIDHYISVNGEVPSNQYLKSELKAMKNWPMKSNIFISNLKTAISYLNNITVEVFMLDYGN